jgi:hypothetical protein
MEKVEGGASDKVKSSVARSVCVRNPMRAYKAASFRSLSFVQTTGIRNARQITLFNVK